MATISERIRAIRNAATHASISIGERHDEHMTVYVYAHETKSSHLARLWQLGVKLEYSEIAAPVLLSEFGKLVGLIPTIHRAQIMWVYGELSDEYLAALLDGMLDDRILDELTSLSTGLLQA